MKHRLPLKLLIWSNSQTECMRFKRMLDTDPQIHIVGQASAEAVSMTELSTPEVILFISNFDNAGDFQELEQVRELGARIVAISDQQDETTIWQAFASGVDGFGLSDIPEVKLVEGLLTIASGQAWLDDRLLRSLIKKIGDNLPSGMLPTEAIPLRKLILSAKEMHVLYLVSEGLDTRQIAQLMSEPEDAVTNCMEEILKKMSRAEPQQQMPQQAACPE